MINECREESSKMTRKGGGDEAYNLSIERFFYYINKLEKTCYDLAAILNNNSIGINTILNQGNTSGKYSIEDIPLETHIQGFLKMGSGYFIAFVQLNTYK